MIYLQIATLSACVLILIFTYTLVGTLKTILDVQIKLLGKLDKANALISEETKRKVAHTKAFENLTDTDKIVEEMERGADIVEARQANRLLAPRPDAGSTAKVFRPRFIGRRASFWNPPAQ